MENRYEKFTSLILNISRCIQKIKNEEMSRYNLKGKQVQCMFMLYSCKDGINATELSKLCDEDKGALSRTLKELSDANFVYTDEVGDKKYRNPIKLTQKGHEFARTIYTRINEMIKLGSAGIDEESRENLYNSLAKVSNNLAKVCESYGGKND